MSSGAPSPGPEQSTGHGGEADSYDVLADVEVSEEAARLLHGWRTTDTPARPA